MRVLPAVLKKEFLQIGRDKLMMRQIFIMPIVQLLILSSAATFEVKRASMYVVDRDHSATSTGLVTRLRASGRFDMVAASPSMALASEAMMDRQAGVIVSIPADFEKDLLRRRAADVQLIFNAEDGAAAGVTQSYAVQIISAYAREAGTELVPTARPASMIDIRSRGWYNPELDYRDYMVPGILVQLVTVIGTLLTAMNIVREKEIGTLDQLSVTPLGRGTFIAAKLIPLWIIAMIELSLGLLVARFVFDVPMIGSLGLVFLACAVYLVAALGIGLWISTLVDTQQQAMFITFFLLMIYLLMSGLFTPVRSMPEWAQWMAQANPVKHIIAIMRSVMLKGATLADVVAPLSFLAAFGAGVLALAIRQHGRKAG
ncbi:MAG TPA: ABC transporter permease [Gemmatimonadaceae bacterium]|nr:ABC transporter permease [Gemmatimonadaceae bacterium]